MDRNDVLAIKIECALAHSRAEARLLQQPSTLAPSAHLRGAFYWIETQFRSNKKAARSHPRPNCLNTIKVFKNNRMHALRAFYCHE